MGVGVAFGVPAANAYTEAQTDRVTIAALNAGTEALPLTVRGITYDAVSPELSRQLQDELAHDAQAVSTRAVGGGALSFGMMGGSALIWTAGGYVARRRRSEGLQEIAQNNTIAMLEFLNTDGSEIQVAPELNDDAIAAAIQHWK
jgi:hypothetical protein